MAELFAMQGSEGWLFFHEQPIKEIDLSNLPEIHLEKNEKHPSVRLRACLYKLWEQTKSGQDFEVFYRAKMDNLCELIKSKLS